ncbi:MAG: methylmalonyl-CoA mutase [Acidimicrobiia bacterium]|nr:methylmalonyl-CoA mutase [Acidimicrobiia bacterium]
MGSNDHIRFVTATSLFDGHDAAINIFRRILQAQGVEVIHLGHNRSGSDIVDTAIEEDAHGIAVTSYQGGHTEFFRYLRDLTVQRGVPEMRIFGGGGGTILPDEGEALADYGITRIYSPDDGREMGLVGMVTDMIDRARHPRDELDDIDLNGLETGDRRQIARLISAGESNAEKYPEVFAELERRAAEASAPVIGVTGTGGAGKSTLVDELVRRYLHDLTDHTIAVISVDPSRRRTGGALLGDRIRMNSIPHERAYMRSLATRQEHAALPAQVGIALNTVKTAGYDLVILETSGIGQASSEVVDTSDMSVYVMTSEYGAVSQLEKIDMLDFADFVVVNKADKRGAEDAVRDVKKQIRRNRVAFDAPEESLGVHATVASQFDDAGTNRFYHDLITELDGHYGGFPTSTSEEKREGMDPGIVPRSRERYLGDIVNALRGYDAKTGEITDQAERGQHLRAVASDHPDIEDAAEEAWAALDETARESLVHWDEMIDHHSGDTLTYQVRGRDIEVPLVRESLSGTKIPKLAMPSYRSWGDRVRWLREENLPGSFPFTAGIYPLKRTAEDPTRMFAGEGTPEQTNRRFHYLSEGMPAKRLSTAFDSVTLYGEDPHRRPDIYGKVGNSGVSISTLDDAKKLYSGFDLVDPATSVSMTINGPAPMILAFFFNAAIDQQCERYIVENGLESEVEEKIARIYEGRERPAYRGELPDGNDGLGLMLLGVSGDMVLPANVYERIAADTVSKVRGTVQADILKEDQAQNTCIFSTEFALRMMGDIQQWFVDHDVRNFYSVSVSGYHMAEAGANPISQLAFTLANGFTYVEYYLSRGMDIDEFAPNLSFFFSNGIDAEYAVIGRVARRIWSKAMRDLYGASERSQKLKYHIQTSGRSLHAQEISFNDIRTTLQALYAIYDNTNSLHTNAYDEAITTPTEESVRRAMAIQLIINRELGLAKNENPLQGAFIIEILTDLVEEAVMAEFSRIDDRGGVLGAMERQYQRTRIQEESMYYEQQKQSGELPVIGVNTFLSDEGSPFVIPDELVRSTDEDKDALIAGVEAVRERFPEQRTRALDDLGRESTSDGNVFAALMEASKTSSLGQMSDTLYHVGGQYRRNM